MRQLLTYALAGLFGGAAVTCGIFYVQGGSALDLLACVVSACVASVALALGETERHDGEDDEP